MRDPRVGELPEKGLRVWTPEGLVSHGLNKTNVTGRTGGLIVFENAEKDTFGVQWDTGQITVHRGDEFAKQLICIGDCATLEEYLSNTRG